MADTLAVAYTRNAEAAERYADIANSEEERRAWRQASRRWRELEGQAGSYLPRIERSFASR